jgi:hypothetical protein
MDAIRQAWKVATIGPLGLQLWACVVLGTLPNGNLQVMRVPLVGAELPMTWTPSEQRGFD